MYIVHHQQPSKFRRYRKGAAAREAIINRTWNRDINAARNIYYKGNINYSLQFLSYLKKNGFFFNFSTVTQK